MLKDGSFKWVKGQWTVTVDFLDAESFSGKIIDTNAKSTQNWKMFRENGSVRFDDPYSIPDDVKCMIRDMLLQPVSDVCGEFQIR